MQLRAPFWVTVLAAVALGWSASGAGGVQTTCTVDAPGGYVDCLTATNPDWEAVFAWHATGVPYRFQLRRPSTDSTWGWWEYNDRALHFIPLSIGGSVTAQIDNRGVGNRAAYWISLAERP